MRVEGFFISFLFLFFVSPFPSYLQVLDWLASSYDEMWYK